MPRNGTAEWAAQAQGYLLSIVLPKDTPPDITRLLRVPCCITFGRLHKLIQIAFGRIGMWSRPDHHEFHVHTRDNRGLIDPGAPPDTTDPSHIVTLQDDADGFADELGDLLSAEEAAKLRESEDVELWEVMTMPVFQELGLSITYIIGRREHDIRFLNMAEEDLGRNMGLPDDQMAFCFGGAGHQHCPHCRGEGGIYPCIEDINSRLRTAALGRNPAHMRGYYLLLFRRESMRSMSALVRLYGTVHCRTNGRSST